MTSTDRYTVISSDCHAGANHETYRDYLEAKYVDDFDAWRAKYSNPFRDLQDDGKSRNWDNDRRIGEMDADGVVAEVIYPNTVPPFFPTGVVITRPPTPEQYELRMAGIKAHNRWLADWCSEHPQRRAGIAQIFLNDVDDAIAETKWAAEVGLRGGILVTPVPPDAPHIQPLYSDAYDELWAVCQDLDMPVNQHSGGAGMPDYGRHRATPLVWISEAQFYGRRGMIHMLLSGVFERFPRLKYILAEVGAGWLLETLPQLDLHHKSLVETGRIGELGFESDVILPLSPSEYAARNCWLGVSFAGPADIRAREILGTDRIMWGSDYPHHEGTYPYTTEALQKAFAGIDRDDVTMMLATNAAKVYGFDLDALDPIAAECGPPVDVVAQPLTEVPADATSPAFTRA
jgi:predicted TIM-barrel fold metal-dependent hydrolase